MAVLEIGSGRFVELAGGCRELWADKTERAWFADTRGRAVGVLLQDPGSGLWGYSICIAKDGGFKRVATAANIPKAELAQRDLVARLHELA